MLKSFIILVLLIVLAAGLALSKPSSDSFRDFYASNAAGSNGSFTGTIKSTAAREYSKTFTYRDHVLWATEEKDGKPVYTGVFAHWFARSPPKAAP